jgi:hypothetical protein
VEQLCHEELVDFIWYSVLIELVNDADRTHVKN